MKNVRKRLIAKDIFICLGIAALAVFIFRLWALVLLVLAAMLIIGILLLFRKPEKQEGTPHTGVQNTEWIPYGDYGDSVYQTILEGVTERVRKEYPEAKWVWAQSNARRRIENGEDVFIILNGGGGYRRAKVKLSNGQVSEIEFFTPAYETVQNDDADIPDGKTETSAEMPPVNYGLLAYEWVEGNILKLNERCNELIGQGNTELVLKADELPIPASWQGVCEELKRAGLSDAECVEGGIKIKFTQN